MGAPDARRFAVYRNNVAVGLIGALEARYPVARRIVGEGLFGAMARAFIRVHKPRSPVMIAYGEAFPEFADAYLASADVPPRVAMAADVARLENAWVEAYHAEDAGVATVADLSALGIEALPQTRIAFHPAARFLRLLTPAASAWAAYQDGADPTAPITFIPEDALITRPDCDVRVRVLPALAYDFARSLRDGATLMDAALALNDPTFDLGTHLVGLVESGAVAAILPGNVMIADAARTGLLAPSNPIARVTSLVFGLVPAWLPLLVLRLALARPFFASGLTRWDGWFTLSFGAKILFEQDYKLHIFGSEIPFPMPDVVAAMASTAEITLPILLAFGILTRWAALGLLVMTGVIQLTYPDGWANFHLYWAAMALAIITFGPGAISLDRLIGLDGRGARKC